MDDYMFRNDINFAPISWWRKAMLFFKRPICGTDTIYPLKVCMKKLGDCVYIISVKEE